MVPWWRLLHAPKLQQQHVEPNAMSAATMPMQSKLREREDSGGQTLPDDMILEVLLRLPAKALCRFRCVCKGWRALISDAAVHAARRSGGCAVPRMVAVFGSKPELELRLLDDFGNVLRVFDVRTPALLASSTRLDLIFIDRAELGAIIMNPASGRDLTIVGTNDCPSSPPWWALAPASPGLSRDYSFGHDVVSGEYKVLRLVTSSLLEWCEVATIMDGSAELTWRKRPWGPFYQESFSCEHKSTVNGYLYFMMHRDPYSAYCRGDDYCIAVFDLESEQWKRKKIDCPLLRYQSEDVRCRVTLTELRGALCMVHNDVNYLVGHYTDIWFLKDPNRSFWVNKYRIQMPQTLVLSTMPLDVLIDGTLLLLNTFWKNERCHRYILQFYNPGTKTFTNFMEMPEGFDGKMAFCSWGLQS